MTQLTADTCETCIVYIGLKKEHRLHFPSLKLDLKNIFEFSCTQNIFHISFLYSYLKKIRFIKYDISEDFIWWSWHFYFCSTFFICFLNCLLYIECGQQLQPHGGLHSVFLKILNLKKVLLLICSKMNVHSILDTKNTLLRTLIYFHLSQIWVDSLNVVERGLPCIVKPYFCGAIINLPLVITFALEMRKFMFWSPCIYLFVCVLLA